MKKIACLLCLLGLAFIMFLAVGCESLTGPEGKYVHRDSSRMDVYALVFEKKKVTSNDSCFDNNTEYYNEWDDYGASGEKYGYYNGYSDDVIDDAFDGCPEATWNVD